MAASAPNKRARSADQKSERRNAILAAADDHLRDVGFEAFSMGSLARIVGLAKGTLYLYFRTREEVFLCLSESKIDDWATALGDALRPGMKDVDFCEAFFRTAGEDATLLPMLMRLNTVIEHNVSIEALIVAKRSLRNRLGQLAADVARALALSPEQGMEVLGALAPLLIGAAQSDQGPSLHNEALPDDVREFIDSFDARRTFIPNAYRILAGIRAGD